MQASPRVAQELHLRVERKESSTASPRTSHNSSGSPRRNGLIDPQEVLVAFQRGVSMGMSHAAQAQIMPPPIYTNYPFYPAFDAPIPQTGVPASGSGDPSLTSSHAFGNSYMASVPGQVSYTNPPANYGHYTQPHPHYVVPNPVVSQYQWPPANTTEDNIASKIHGPQEDR